MAPLDVSPFTLMWLHNAYKYIYSICKKTLYVLTSKHVVIG